MRETAAGVEERRFENSRWSRVVKLVFLGALFLFDLTFCLASSISFIHIFTGWTPPPNVQVTDQFSTIIFSLMVLTMLNAGFILVFSMFPDVHVHGDSFRLSTLFYTSPWLDWEDINDVRLHFLFDSIIVISVDNISRNYDFVAGFQQAGSRAFLISKGIRGIGGIGEYEELIEILRRKRPDLFPIPRR